MKDILNIKSREKVLISRLLLLLMLFQFIFTLPVEVFADSKASAEIILRKDGEVVSGGSIKIMEQGVRPLSFIKENGIYKADKSGFYKEIQTGSKGELILSGLDVGIYTALYLEENKTKGVVNFNIESKSDFKQVEFNISDNTTNNNGNSNSNNNTNNNTNNNSSSTNSKADIHLRFQSENVDYRIEDANGRRLKFRKNGSQYTLGGSEEFIKSGRNVILSSMDYGKYYVIGQGKKYTIDLNESNNKFSIADNHIVEEIIEEIIETGSTNISIKNRKTKDKFENVLIKILKNNGNTVKLRKVTDSQYVYDEDGNVDFIEYNGKDIKILGMPVGDYTILDISDDGIEFEDTKLSIKKDKTAIIDILKDPLENDLKLELELNTESDLKLDKKDTFTFNIEDSNGNLLTFKEDGDSYVYDEDGEKDIEISSKGIELLNIPAKEIYLILKDGPKAYDLEVEKVKIDLIEEDEYVYLIELVKYTLELINEENTPVKGVSISILNSKDKEITSDTSDEEGLLEFEGLDEKEEYKLRVNSVPSPYSLPNQGQEIEINIKDEEIILDEIDNSPIVMGSHEKKNDKKKDKIKEEDEDLNKDLENDKEIELIKETNVLRIPFAEFIAKTSSGKEGSIFSFVDKDGEEVYRLISEEGGEVGVNKINHGEYVVTQLTVADGYKISEEKYKLVVNGNYVSQEYTFDNPKIGEGEDVVERENKSDKTIAIVLIILVLFFAFINLYISNQRYKEEHGKNKYKIFDKIDEMLGGEEEFETLSEEELEDYEGNNIDKDKESQENEIHKNKTGNKVKKKTKKEEVKKGKENKEKNKENIGVVNKNTSVDDDTMVLNMKDIEKNRKKDE